MTQPFDFPSARLPLDPTQCHIVVEDEAMVSEILAQSLRVRFRPMDVRIFSEGVRAVAHCTTHPPDLLIADLDCRTSTAGR